MVSGDQPRSTAPATPEEAFCPADIMLVRTWLHNRSENTARAYRADVAEFARFTGKPMAEVQLADLQEWHDSMSGASDATRRRRMSAVKSVLTHGAKLGFLPHDAGAAFRLERGRDSLNERILSRQQVLAMLSAEKDPRRHALLALLYGTGLRLSEACGLRWRDMTRRQSGGIATVFGKGSKTRHVQVSASLWKEIVAVKVDGGPDAPVIPGHDGGPLHVRAAHRVVKRATAKQWDGVRQIWCDPPGSSLRPVFAGLGKSWRPDRTSVEIDLLDATYWLDGTMPVSVYGGTGRLDGDSNVAGKSMPRMRGSVCNVTPVLIDSVNYVYQISDGPASVSMLYEGSYPGGITFAGTVADIYANSPAPGTYTVQSGSAGTWLRLGTKPVYGITVDAVGTFRSGAAPANVLDILRQMLLEDLVLPAEYIDAGWPASSGLAPWAGGWYWDGSESVTGQQAATTLLSGLCITLVPTRTGTLLPILLTAPDPSETPAAELNADLITDISAATLDSSLDPPTWRWRIGWQHNFTVQASGSGLHPQAPADRQAVVAVADRAAVWWSAQIKSHWRVPNDPALITTALASQADAVLVAQRHGALWGTQRRLWAVAVPQDLAWGIDLGDVVGITAPAAGLTDRQLARVVSEQIRATDQTVTFQILV